MTAGDHSNCGRKMTKVLLSPGETVSLSEEPRRVRLLFMKIKVPFVCNTVAAGQKEQS